MNSYIEESLVEAKLSIIVLMGIFSQKPILCWNKKYLLNTSRASLVRYFSFVTLARPVQEMCTVQN